MTHTPSHGYVISYLNLRKALGALGFLFPVVLILGHYTLTGGELLSTISSYYHGPMRDLFVGVLCVMAMFMFSYHGPEPKDNWIGNFAGVALLGIAFLPTPHDNPLLSVSSWLGRAHLISALLFFLAMAYFCLRLFTKTSDPATMTPHKKQRNRVYRVCGYLIVLCILLIGLLMWLTPNLAAYYPALWLETIAMMAFGFAWMVKGEALLGDVGGR